MYKLTAKKNIVIRIKDNACIPFDITNSDYADYLAWISHGNAPLPADHVIEPVVEKRFASLEFLDLFTEAEQIAVATAAMQSADVKLWYDRMLAAMYITISDPRTEAGLGALVAAGLLTSPRKDAIVSAMQ